MCSVFRVSASYFKPTLNPKSRVTPHGADYKVVLEEVLHENFHTTQSNAL